VQKGDTPPALSPDYPSELGAAMILAQKSSADMMMYSTSDVRSKKNGLFTFDDHTSAHRYAAFNVMRAYGRLYKLGNQVELTCDNEDVYAVAATDGKRGCLMISNHKEEAVPLTISANADEFICLITAEGRVDTATVMPEELPANSVLSVMYTL
jgi:hypothetical protein